MDLKIICDSNSEGPETEAQFVNENVPVIYLPESLDRLLQSNNKVKFAYEFKGIRWNPKVLSLTIIEYIPSYEDLTLFSNAMGNAKESV